MQIGPSLLRSADDPNRGSSLQQKISYFMFAILFGRKDTKTAILLENELIIRRNTITKNAAFI